MDIPANSDLDAKIEQLKKFGQHYEVLVFQTPSENRDMVPGSFELRIPFYRGRRSTQILHYSPAGQQLFESFIINTVI